MINLTQSEEFKAGMSALHRKTRSRQILIAYDTLESYKIFEPFMLQGLKGIIEAIQIFLTDDRAEGISLKFFIPAEVYDEVVSDFPGKTQPSSVFLRWRSRDLVSMLARRYLGILIRTQAIPKTEIAELDRIVGEAYRTHDGGTLREKFWYLTEFIPRRIVNRRGMEEDCFAYMIRHTQRRPRDMITQMQSIIDYARDRGEFPYISQDSVIAGVHDDVSLLQILQDALTPYEGSLPESLIQSARSIFYKRPVIMEGRELFRFAKELYNLHQFPNISERDFVGILMRCGVVGIVEDQERGHQAELYIKGNFEYIMQGQIPQSERFTYCIHPAMGDTFKMQSPEGTGVVYPNPIDDRGGWLEREAGISAS